jgi:hypothetical protein
MASPLSDMVPTSSKQNITGGVLLKTEGLSDGFDLHPAFAHMPHFAHYVGGKNGFVMPFAVSLSAVINSVLMVFLCRHPFKVFNAVVKLLKVFVIHRPASYTYRAGWLANKCKRDKLMDAGHPFFTLALQQYEVVFFHKHFSEFAPFNTSAVSNKTGYSPNKPGIANFIESRIRLSRHWLPYNFIHG